MSLEIKELALGQKIRKLRENLGKTLTDYASEVGLSSKLLEQIEQNEITPPIVTLLNMAHVSGVELNFFFDKGPKDPLYAIVRKGAESSVERVLPQGKNPLSYRYASLAADKRKKMMEPFLIEFLPKKEKVPQVAHDGEEFMHVLSGKIEFTYKNKKKTLNTGDSLYFDSKNPHAFRAVGGKKAKAIVVLYPH